MPRQRAAQCGSPHCWGWGWGGRGWNPCCHQHLCAHKHAHARMQKAFRNFHLFKRAGPKSIKCWPGLQAGLAEAAWVAELYEKQMGSSLGPGQAIVFTTKSTSQLEAIHVPTTLHQAFPHPTCRMAVPSGCWAQEQTGASTQPENLWFRFTLHPSGIPHHDSCCGLSRQGSSCFYFWFWTFCHQASKNSSAAIYIHIVSEFLFCLAQASF